MKNKLILLTLLGAVLAGCTSQFEEINTNPNNMEVAPSINILTYVQRYYCAQYGGVWLNYNESSSIAGQVTKIRYIDEARYSFRPTTTNDLWNRIYQNIGTNLNKIIEYESGADGNNNMVAVATIFKAHCFQVLTDHLGDIPYFDAYKAAEGIYFPAYDPQRDIYDALIKDVQSAVAMINENPSATQRWGANDMFFAGNMTRWKKFGNSLLLRMAIRLSYVDQAKAAPIISGILSNPANVMESNDDNLFFKWPGGTYQEPLASAEILRKDYAMCSYIMSVLKETNDPRLPIYAAPAPQPDDENGVYKGMPPGISVAMSVMAEYAPNSISPVGQRYNSQPNADGSTYLMRYSEIEFIRAEAIERGIIQGDAKAAYENAIRASLEENGATDFDAYMAQAKVAYDAAELPNLLFASNALTNASPENNACANPTVAASVKLQKIAYQKWLALFSTGPEAWAEVRRTDIPVIGPAIGAIGIDHPHNRAPFRWIYSIDELTNNGTNYEQALKKVQDYYWGEKMYWDIRTGVN